MDTITIGRGHTAITLTMAEAREVTEAYLNAMFNVEWEDGNLYEIPHTPPRRHTPPTRPCPCECNSGGFCGGCGHAGCGGRRPR